MTKSLSFLKSIGKDIIIYGTGSILFKLVPIIMIPIYTKIFSPSEYGILDLIISISLLISVLGLLQLESALARFYYDYSGKQSKKILISTVFWAILLCSSVIALIFILLSTSVSNLFFNSGSYRNPIIAASISVILYNINALFSVIIRFEKKPTLFLVISTIQMVFNLAISYYSVVVLHVGIIGALLGQIAGLISAILIYFFLYYNYFAFAWRISLLKDLLRYSLPIVPSVGVNWANNYLNKFILLFYTTTFEVGLLSMALKCVAVFTLFEGAFNMAWTPFLYKTLEKKNHKEIITYFYSSCMVILLSLTLIFILFASDIFKLLIDQTYWKSLEIVSFLSIAASLRILTGVVGVGPNITKQTYYITIISLISLIINLLSLVILVPLIGILGFAISLLITNTLVLISSWLITERVYPLVFKKLLSIFAFLYLVLVSGYNYLHPFNIWVKISVLLFFLIGIYLLPKFNQILNKVKALKIPI
ncbi:MAG: lipopolysaccharide biosynthesis protein [Ekhidna sp.]|nr:lipopolysaccharide biosynthesis protein [Ekhidna sp.]